MQNVFDWIIENWQLVLSVLLFLLSFILQLIKKKPNESMFETLYKAAILGINYAEDAYPKGTNGKYSEKKLRTALDIASQYISKVYPKVNFAEYQTKCGLIIKSILSMPQDHLNDER